MDLAHLDQKSAKGVNPIHLPKYIYAILKHDRSPLQLLTVLNERMYIIIYNEYGHKRIHGILLDTRITVLL